MSQIILFTIITLVAIGATAAIILYFVAQKFKVFEDPRIDQVEEALACCQLRRLRISRLPELC